MVTINLKRLLVTKYPKKKKKSRIRKSTNRARFKNFWVQNCSFEILDSTRAQCGHFKGYLKKKLWTQCILTLCYSKFSFSYITWLYMGYGIIE